MTWWLSTAHLIHLTMHQLTFFIFPKVKTTFKGRRFDDVKDTKEKFNLKKKPPLDALDDCFVKLLERYKKCVAVKRHYFE
jgi:predicted metal-dependent hydrolase